jgi:hypothetical protein
VENVPGDRDHHSGHRDHSSGDRNPLIAITPEQLIGIPRNPQ